MLIGYARVSTDLQDTQMQLDALKFAGVELIFSEKTSSVGRRVQLHLAIAALSPGDVLVVWKLDRIARSLMDLLSLIDQIKTLGAGLRSLTEPIDTATPMGIFVIQILGSMAQFERSIIRERSIAGSVAAVRRGVVIGRPRTFCDEKESEILAKWRAGGASAASLSREYNVHYSVIRRLIYSITRPEHPWIRSNRPVLGPFLVDEKR